MVTLTQQSAAAGSTSQTVILSATFRKYTLATAAVVALVAVLAVAAAILVELDVKVATVHKYPKKRSLQRRRDGLHISLIGRLLTVKITITLIGLVVEEEGKNFPQLGSKD